MKIVIADKARDDLTRIFLYIFERNPQAAEAVVWRINRNSNRYRIIPFIGRERPHLELGFAVLCGDSSDLLRH